MIIRARIVVTMDGPPIENGAVVVSGDRIASVGKFPDVAKTYSDTEVVDLGERALVPGLINAHCHLDYTCLRGAISRQESFTAWIRAINEEKAKLSPQDYVASINDGFLEAKRFGTTTIANLTAFPELVSQIETPLRTWWFAELIDVRDPDQAHKIVDRAVEGLKSEEHWGLAPHAPFTASANLYRSCEEIARRKNILLTTHLAESREEREMFQDARGPLYAFLQEIGRDMGDCGNSTPVEHFLGRGGSPNRPRAIEDNRSYLLVHLNEFVGGDFEVLRKSANEFSIVHCPRSHEYFGHSPFQFEKLRDAAFNICLGTDSLASNNDLSLFAEMRAFQKEFSNIAPEKIFEMVTLNPARALRQETTLAKIRRGSVADLIAIPSARSNSIFEQIIAFDRAVVWSMLSGRILA
ncbi:MAG TPA: amidohydrolase family protein [Chthoniobacterales bacterium]|nr:amidohydrolase family protein [Chthoniobacterales bacterium]